MDTTNMSWGQKVQCNLCEKEDSLMWHRSDKGVMCSECHDEYLTNMAEEASEDQDQKSDEAKSKKPFKIIRSYKTRLNSTSTPKPITIRSKSRRSAVFKKNIPYKSPSARATYVTMNQCYQKGELYTVGDVVSVRNVDGNIYFAQLTGLMQDQYCEKSCTITWLLPTKELVEKPYYSREVFQPMYYVLGPEEDMPRRLEYFQFEMRCPGNYWKMDCPFPTRAPDLSDTQFMWSRLHGAK